MLAHRRLKFLLPLILLGGPTATAASGLPVFSEARLREIATSPTWSRLLHYRKPFLRRARSDVDQPAFFLSREGADTPEAELRALIAAALDPHSRDREHGTLKQPVVCAFPARIHYLKQVLGDEFSTALPAVDCPAFESWSRSIAAQGVSLVFSSAFPGNPASMFGHTLLRLDRGSAPDDALRSYGVNFSASVPARENPVKYAISGLVGAYLGRYDLAPYYLKVNEYTYSESRDLWEYRLSLNREETDQLVRHLWELYTDGFFRYYFIDENCSFQILTALEAVRPDWDLSTGFGVSVLPIATVKKLTDTLGAVSEVSRRASLRSRLDERWERITPSERNRVEALFLGKERLRPDETLPVLEALILALSHRKTSGKPNPGGEAMLREALVLRATKGRAPEESASVREPAVPHPESYHPTSRIGAWVGRRGRTEFTRYSFAGFEHAFLDRTPSFNAFSEVRVFRAIFEKSSQSRLRLERGDVLGMASFASASRLIPQPSWRIALSWLRPLDLTSAEGRLPAGGAWLASGGYGLGRRAFRREHLAYLLAAAEAETGSALRERHRFSPGAEAGLIFHPIPERLALHLQGTALWDAFASESVRWRWRSEATVGFTAGNRVSLRANFRIASLPRAPAPAQIESSLGMNWMF